MGSFIKGIFLVAGMIATISCSIFKDNTLSILGAVFVSTFALMNYIDGKFQALKKELKKETDAQSTDK